MDFQKLESNDINANFVIKTTVLNYNYKSVLNEYK